MTYYCEWDGTVLTKVHVLQENPIEGVGYCAKCGSRVWGKGGDMGDGWKKAVAAARATQPRPKATPLQAQLKPPNHGECVFLDYWRKLSPGLIMAVCGPSLAGKVLAESFVITPESVGQEQPVFGPRGTWHFDFAFPLVSVGIEIDGGQGMNNNPHQKFTEKFERDRERDNWAVEHGWVVLRYTMAMLDNPDAVIGQVVRVVRGRL